MSRFRLVSVFLILALSVVPYTSVPSVAAEGSTVAASPEQAITFDHANIVDPFRLISEPNLAIDSHGAVYTSGPGGSAAQSSTFWKSDDNGIQYHLIGMAGEVKQNSVLGGGDTEYAFAKDDTMYAADQEFLLCNATFRSTDRGNTFTTGETCLPGTDRPWMAVYDPTGTPEGRRVYFAANETQLGCYLNVSTDDGLTYLPANGGTGVFGGNSTSCRGHLAVDPTNGTLYIPAGNGIWKSTDGGKTMRNLGNPSGLIRYTLFGNLATDTAGNLYYLYSRTGSGANGSGPIMLAMMPKGSETWSTPVQVSTPDLQRNIFPWIVAGDPGRVAMMYVSTPDNGFSNTGPALGSTAAEWHVYANITTNAITCNPDCTVNPSPTFNQVQADDHTMHKGSICIGGFPGCLQGQADRSMADFFVINIDPRDGRPFLVWNDNADRDPINNIGKSYVTIARMRTGPSLFEDEGFLLPPNMTGDVAIANADIDGQSVQVSGTHGLPPGNYSTDPSGDAIYPTSPLPGENIPALDITETSVSDQGANYTFTMKVSDLSQAAIARAAGTAGTPSWMVTWWDKGNALTDEHYFVKWRGVGTTAEFGRVGDVLYPALGAPAPKFLTYAPAGTTTAAVDGNTITITVPKASVGNPEAGHKIDSVTGYALSEKGPQPSVVDAAKAFSYTVGTPAGAEHDPDGYVEVSLDDPTFSNSVTAAMSEGEWTASLPAPSTAGSHTYYARQVLSADLYPDSWSDVTAGPSAQTSLTVRVPKVSVGGATLTEGDSGQKNAAFTVSLNEASTDTVTVPYSVAGATAVTPEDFSAGSGEVTIPAGQTSVTVNVPVNGDTEPEPTEAFLLTLGSPQNADLASAAVGTGTIRDNDAMPRCTILGTEGNDVLKGTGGNDVICGFGGSDTIDGLQGNDVILGGAGVDTILGGNGNDVIRGQERDDTLRGGNGDDVLLGGAGADGLFGETGADILNSSDGVFFNDSNDGGSGTDNCAGDVGDRVTSCP